ncbi:MAG: hypothetical protein OXG61_09360 [Chloroflexi bacterium]|nr:hypothetical protein [Chloroflexota bacterium]
MSDGGGGFIPPPIGEDFGTMKNELLEQRMRHDGHRPPERPKGPRFGLLRRLVRLVRGGGD